MNYPWGHNRPINLASNDTKREFGGRVQKVTIDAGFSCPNRDGTLSTGGCSFCNNNAFNPGYCEPSKPIRNQIEQGILFHKSRYRKADKFLAYFQAYSNTYADVEILRKRYYEALETDGIIGLVIGTRPDCINEKILTLLEEINASHHMVVEYGVESVYNETLIKINRGHSFEKSKWAIEQTAKRNIKTGAHFIFGLPGENKEMMLKSSATISSLPIKTVKFHQLQIVKGTEIGKVFLRNPKAFNLFELEEYIEFIIDFLSFLRPDIVVERLAGETQPDYNLAKKWNIRYDQVLQLIEKKMIEKNTWQGKNYS